MSFALWFLADVTVGLALAILVMDWWVRWRLEYHRKRGLAGYQPDAGHQCDDVGPSLSARADRFKMLRDYEEATAVTDAVQEVSRQAGAAYRAAKRPPPTPRPPPKKP